MPSQNRTGWLRRSATTAFLLGALPLALAAQVRRPDAAPARAGSAGKPKRRTDFIVAGGTVKLSEANATQRSVWIGSVGIRKQLSPEWLNLGGVIEVGSSSVNGEFFPYEKRVTADTTRFVSVNGRATLVAARVNADVMFPLGESEKFAAGFGVNAGMYGMMPSPAGGKGAGTFVAPTFGASLVGQADLTRRLGVQGTFGFAKFMNFNRDKLRPSDPALEDAVFTTPLAAPRPPEKSFGGARITVGLTYRLGVKTISQGARK